MQPSPAPVLVRYAVSAAIIYAVTTQPASAWLKLTVAYALLGVFLLSSLRQFSPAQAARLAPYDSDSDGRLLATTVGYFLLIMALRLPVYARTGQIWEKTPMIVLVLSSLLLWERARPADFGLHGRELGRQLIAGAVGSAVVWAGVAIGFLTRYLVYTGVARVAIGGTAVGAWYNLLMFSYGNFAEELFFRGYVQTKLTRRWGAAQGILGQAVLFSLYHVNYRIFPAVDWGGLAVYLWFTFAFGIVMGIVTQQTRGLIAPTIIHVAYNVTWPGSLFYLGIAPATVYAETFGSATLPWAVFLAFVTPMLICTLTGLGYPWLRHRRAAIGGDPA